MAQQIIGIGSTPNDGTGDNLRAGAIKINANFTELYAAAFHFLGTFVSSSALTTAHPTASAGDYAYVDAGVSNPVEIWIWDNDDSQWVQGGSAGIITDGQGTTANGTAVDLGGDISTAVALNLEPGGSFSVSPASLPALSIDIGSSGAFMRTTDVTFSFNSDGTVVFNDSRASPVGIEYANDYSGTFTNRSLVDKEYVDNAVGGGGAVTSVFGRTGVVTAQSGDYSVAQVTGAAPLADPTFTGTPDAPTPALTINTTQLATTAFVRSILQYVTPEMFGAVGDGVTDDSTSINNAIATGIPVYFGQKNYRIATTLTTTDNTYLFGSGSGSIISVATNIAIITIGGINGTIENLQLLGSGSGAAQNAITAVGNGSFNLYRYNTRVVNVFFNDLGNAGMYTINTIGNDSGSEHQGTYYAVNCRALSCAVGYLMDTRGEYNTFSNCLADNCPVGVRFNGGNNAWTGGNVVDCTIGVFIGSGTNDGHGVISGGRINHANITCTSTATGYAFVGVEIVASSISLTSCTDIRFYNCDIASSPITSTSSVGTVFYGNCFRTTPTITVAAGNTPSFVFNTFPAASTVHSLIVNTVQGGISQTQQGPTSPNTFTSTWTTTASAQFAHKFIGTLTPRATASDTISGVVIDISLTATANTQNYYALDINPTGTLSAGGFTGTEVGGLRVRGKVRLRDLTTSGAVSATSGFTYEKSNGDMIIQMSPDAIVRVGNAGSPWQFTSTSDGLVANNNGNGALFSIGGIGANFSATNTGAGTTNSRGIGIIGGSSITSGATEYAALRIIPTYNQTGTATGDVLGIDYQPTITALLGNHYFIRNRSIAANSAFATVSAPTAKIFIGASTTAAGTAPLKFTSGTVMTTAETGAFEYDGTNLFFTRTGTTRESVICANAVNAVAPTAPDRTVTVIIAGTTYYLHAKTTND